MKLSGLDWSNPNCRIAGPVPNGVLSPPKFGFRRVFMRAGVIRLCILTAFIAFALIIVCFNGKAQKSEARFSRSLASFA